MRLAFALTASLFLLSPASADEPACEGADTGREAAAPVYELPFKGKARRVTQASDGKTHKGVSQYAIDFAMPRGTPLYAAREGVVIKAVGHHEEVPKAEKKRTGKKGAPNSIRIEHPDGTHGIYLHLNAGGVVVKVGERVKAGQLIGYSGNTGKSSGPHLHFVVFGKASPRGKRRSIPVEFVTADAQRTSLERGKRYANPG